MLKGILEDDEIAQNGRFVAKDDPSKNPSPHVSFSEYGSYYLNLQVYYWYFIGETGEELDRRNDRGWFSYLDHCTLVNQRILRAFAENDIEFAFPTQTIELEKKTPPESEDSQESETHQ